MGWPVVASTPSGIEVVVESLGVGLPVADIDNGGADPRIGDISNVIVCPINECFSLGTLTLPAFTVPRTAGTPVMRGFRW